MKIKTKALAIFLLPIIVLAAWAFRLRYQGTAGVDVELPVEGFDPLDHISGHYVTYRLAMGHHDPCRPTHDPLIDRQEERCLCFDESAKPQTNWAGSCAAKPSDCQLYLKGSCPWSGFTAGVERFYIPEADSPLLKVVPPKSRIILTLTGSGQALVKAFLPEGEDYNAWIQRKKTDQKTCSLMPCSWTGTTIELSEDIGQKIGPYLVWDRHRQGEERLCENSWQFLPYCS